jgi:thiol-disulfide isomerase/thioredoxin
MPNLRIPPLAVAVLCLVAASPAHAQEIQWRHDYEAARREAREKNRPLFIDFGTANCTWCKKLDASTFRDPAIVKEVNEKFIALKIDAEANRRLTSDLQIGSFPTLVFAAPDGKILSKQEGFVEAGKLGQQLRQVVSIAVAPSTTAPGPAAIAKIDVPSTPPAGAPELAVRITVPPPESVDLTASDPPQSSPLMGQIKADPALALKTAEKLAEQLGLAENALRQNHPQEAAAHLERVLQVCPASALAQTAQRRLDQLRLTASALPQSPVIRGQSK